MLFLDGKSVLITGGTGSLGKTLLKRILTGEMGTPAKIIIFSRDEAKQHQMRLEYQNKKVATDEIIFHNFEEFVEFYIGDVREANRGETYIPRMPSARVVDIAELLIGNRDINKNDTTGIRPGEKIHEILISEEECHRTVERGQYYAIKPILPELMSNIREPIALRGEYSSGDNLMDKEKLRILMDKEKLFIGTDSSLKEEYLR